ncbi:tol-pal system protein YbgF [Hymenobacter busanensis]|uniref:Tol-pal system protein YbgF n=1 Tax=Hymenobacter busanensis TaxID=2607656 RepID=A0A7L5A414_9BACT|nr:tol-pal system protein YbgF [Hymenobacter busanensis]KAA9338153.1 tol-pal system protein YbgF [Hymenobacter busanensis]QHJ09422.1 tol-pal system protein YbgF [Hymenobacter busanensis]
MIRCSRFLILPVWFVVALLALGASTVRAQQTDTARVPAPIRNIQLENVDVAPSALDYSGWLLLDRDIQLELDGAIQNLYNFKYDKAEKQFRSLKRRYPNHPMPYFLLGLSQWWKIMPSNITSTQYDRGFYAYMDSAITKGEALYGQNNKNYEACFFLSAAYGFDARLHAERKDWRKATVSSKRALAYLDKSQEANDLSPEFLFGQALMNYYAPWISQEYPLLRPVLLFFPKGNKELGLRQLRSVADNGFYTGNEARVFLMKIYMNTENQPAEALPMARYLASKYPDNGYFQRFYALVLYNQGRFQECEQVSRSILDKLNRGYAGYESISGKYATYFLGSLMHRKYEDLPKAKEYYQRSIVFAEANGETRTGFYLYAHLNLARIAEQQKDPKTAARYYAVVEDKWEDRKAAEYREAKLYLKQHRKS